MRDVKIPQPAVIDFETFKIDGASPRPPVPTSVAIKMPGEETQVYIFGHPSGNTHTFSEAQKALMAAFACDDGVCAYNLKFDLAVAEYYFSVPRLDASKYHDAMILAFLHDPNSKTIALKPLSEQLLALPPDERDAVADWLHKTQPFWNFKVSASSTSSAKHPAGAYTAFVPGDIVAAYVKGDVDRTALLFDKLYHEIVVADMLDAYHREMKILLIMADNERRGLRINVDLLREDIADYEARQQMANEQVRYILCAPDLNINSGAQLIEAMSHVKMIDLAKVGRTPTGAYKSDAKTLEAACTNRTVAALIKYHAQISTCLRTFMKPWLEMAEKYDGRIYTSWNQVRSADGGAKGTRTGRFSSTPNFQNIPKEFPDVFSRDAGKDGLPKWVFNARSGFKYRPLPQMRRYILPEEGHVILDRDYSQQEVRILAHFEDGALMKQYIEAPWTDGYTFTQEYINATYNTQYSRKVIKSVVLGTMYGMGNAACAAATGLSVSEAQDVRNVVNNALPGISILNASLHECYKNEQPFYTMGGRRYYCEEPIWKDGRRITFEYKMINTLIQGSAADVTKQAIVNLHNKICAAGAEDKMIFMLSVHDEIVVSCAADYVDVGMQLLKEAMEEVKCDVVLLSEGKTGENLADLIDYDKKGKKL